MNSSTSRGHSSRSVAGVSPFAIRGKSARKIRKYLMSWAGLSEFMDLLGSQALELARAFEVVVRAAAELAERARRRGENARRLLAVLTEHALDLERADLAPCDRGRGVDQLALACQERLVGEALRPRLPSAMRERIVGAGRDLGPAQRQALGAHEPVERAVVDIVPGEDRRDGDGVIAVVARDRAALLRRELAQRDGHSRLLKSREPPGVAAGGGSNGRFPVVVTGLVPVTSARERWTRESGSPAQARP